MSEAEWCMCVTRRGFIPGDTRRAEVVRLDTSLQATWVAVIGCPTCSGTGSVDTLDTLAKEWREACERNGTPLSTTPDFWIDNCIRTRDPKCLALLYTPQRLGAKWNASASLIARTEAFIARERASDTLESLAKEMASVSVFSVSEMVKQLQWAIQQPGVTFGVSWGGRVGLRADAFVKRERAKLAAIKVPINAAPTLPTSRDFDALVAHVRALGRENESAIPAARRVEALLAELRTALDEVSCVRPVSPASTLATTIPAEPVGMASDGDDETCW